mgnify:FL=1
MDKPAYTLEEYRCLRKHNREICRYFPEDYGKVQNDWEPTYEICIDGVAYVMPVWNVGIKYIKRKYKANIYPFPSFRTVFALGRRLPDNISYAKASKESSFSTQFSYIEHGTKFETYESGEKFTIVPFYGDKERIKEVILSV